MFPGMACLGIRDSDAVTLLPMPADPSSAEQFSFACAELGRDASVEFELRDRMEALRGLLSDETSIVSRRCNAAVSVLCHLFQERNLRRTQLASKQWTLEDCKDFVRMFAQEQNFGIISNIGDWKGSLLLGSSSDILAGLMLSEKTVYSSAVEYFRAYSDSPELVGFAEACLVELLAENVGLALAKLGLSNFGSSSAFEHCDTAVPTKPIPVPG